MDKFDKKALIKKVLRILNKYDLTDDYSYECQEARDEIRRLGEIAVGFTQPFEIVEEEDKNE